MSLHRRSSGRKPLLRRRDVNIIRTLTYNHDSDGESSCHDDEHEAVSVDQVDSAMGSSPISSPEHECSVRMDDQSSEFLDLDIPAPCLVSSPRLARRITRSRRLSPIPFGLDESDDHDDEQRVPGFTHMAPSACPVSPPHRRLRALRLFDTPHTPKSLLQRARKRRPTDEKEKKTEKLQANVNPFTPVNNPPSAGFTSGKRNRSQMEKSVLDSSTEDELEDDMPSTKKIALREINTSRYNEEFHEICKLGDGEFGSVLKCVHRLDGCTYAIKKSKCPVAGSVYERNAMNEVYAHAVLGKHPHVVRYYSAWAEDDHMYIQNEYCNGGSLAEVLEDHQKTHRSFNETEIKQILYQSAQGLRYIHSQNLVHLDIKPGNIFIHRNPRLLQSPESGLESCEEDDEFEEAVIYKIGDLGHVTSVSNPSVEEGDCRYLPREILDEDFEHLTKSDVFSLGLTIYEVGGGKELPKNGEKWHAIRRGELPDLPHCSQELNNLLKSMILPDPTHRPSALALAQHPILCPHARKTKEQLQRELNEERFKNQMLSRKLIEATQCLVQGSFPTSAPNPSGRSSRLVGYKMKRSMSLSAF